MSALLFMLVVDRVCKPMLIQAQIDLNLVNERLVAPVPVQAYADDIAAFIHSLFTLRKMIQASEPAMEEARLDAKVSKSGCFFMADRYTGKRDELLIVTFQGKELTT